MKKILLAIIMSSILLSGCGRYSAWYKIEKVAELAGLMEETEYEETDNVKEELGTLSDDEKRILSRDGYYAKERIYAGHLYDNEIKKVKNVRGAKKYLEKKYPNREFKITLYEARGKKSSSPTGNIGDDVLWLSVDGESTGKWVMIKETETELEFYDNVSVD